MEDKSHVKENKVPHSRHKLDDSRLPSCQLAAHWWVNPANSSLVGPDQKNHPGDPQIWELNKRAMVLNRWFIFVGVVACFF